MKPGFFKNEHLSALSPMHRLCFAGLWLMADRKGVLEDRPRRIKGELFAYENVEIEPILNDLESGGFLLRYKVKENLYIQIVNFKKHQRPHNSEPVSELPEPVENPPSHAHSQGPHGDAALYNGNGNGDLERGLITGKGTENGDGVVTASNGKAPSDHAAALKHYTDRYQAKFHEKPNISGGKDGATLKRLLKTHGLDAVKRRIDNMLHSRDGFIQNSGCTIGVLSACWNKLSTTESATGKTAGTMAALTRFANRKSV